MPDQHQALREPELRLLGEILSKHAPPLLPLLDALGERRLTRTQREELRGVLLTELLATGFKDRGDEEANERGLAVAEIIDRLWHLSEDGLSA